MANHSIALCPLPIPEAALRAWISFDLERTLGGAILLEPDGSFLLKPLPGDPPGDPVRFQDSILFLNERLRPESRHPRSTSEKWLASFLFESAGMAFGACCAKDEGIGQFILSSDSLPFLGLARFAEALNPILFSTPEGRSFFMAEMDSLRMTGNPRSALLASDPDLPALAPWAGSFGFADYLQRAIPKPSRSEADALLLVFASLPGDPIPEDLLARSSAKARRAAFECSVRSSLSRKASDLAPFAPPLTPDFLRQILKPFRGPLLDGNLSSPDELPAIESRASSAFEAAQLSLSQPASAPSKPRRPSI